MSDALATLDSFTGGSKVGDEIRAIRDNDVAMVTTFSEADKIVALSAMTNSTPLVEAVNTTLHLTNIVIHEVTLNARDGEVVDDESGEVAETIQAARIVLATADGKAYHAVSKGVMTSVKNILGVAGDPSTWPGALEVTVKQEGRAPRAYLTLKTGNFVTPKAGK